MKNIIYKMLPICLLALSLAGCKEDVMFNPLPKAVPMTMTVNAKAVIMGEHLKVDITSNMDEDGNIVPPNEDIDIYFTAKVKGEDVSDLFEPFTKVVTFPKGEKQIQIDFPVKSSGLEGSRNVELTAFSRGYNIANSSQVIKVSDYYRVVVSIENNDSKVVMEGDQFVLVAKVDKPSSVPIMVTITPEDPARFKNLPTYLTIPAGMNTVKSGKIMLITDGVEAGDLDVKLGLESNASDHPMVEDNLTFLALDAESVNPDMYEMIYDNMDMMFVSDRYKDDTWFTGKTTKLMTPGDPHPNASLATEGWKFLTATEIHFISGFYMPPVAPLTHNTLNNGDSGFGGDAIIGANYEGLPNLAIDNNLCSNVDEEGKVALWARKEGTNYKIGSYTINKMNPKFWGYNHVLIYPGMRVEFKVRLGGTRTGIAPAISLRDQTVQTNWSTRTISVLKNEKGTEITQSVAGGTAVNNVSAAEVIEKKTNMPKADTWNVYWVEWVEDGTIRLGINSLTTLTVDPSDMLNWNYQFKKEDSRMVEHPFGTGTGTFRGREGLYVLMRMTPASGVGSLSSGWDAALGNEQTAPRMDIDWIRFYTNKNYKREATETPVDGIHY